MDTSYWHKQTASKPLFTDVEWNKPERRDQAGRLGIIGGNKLGFAGVATSFMVAQETGAGQVRVVLPEALKPVVPATITDAIFAKSNSSGGLASDALTELLALGEWSNGVLLAGDAGRNSETAIVYEQFIEKYHGPLTITRDAIDLVKNDSGLLVDRPDTMIVGSFAQIQKLFQAVYYPKMLTFSMQLLQLVEALHKFTLTYPVSLVTLHNEQLIIASGGQVVTQDWDNPMRIWRGETAARIATYQLWSSGKTLEYAAAAIAKS